MLKNQSAAGISDVGDTSISNALLVITATLFLTRSFLDPILDATKITAGGSAIGLGAVINAILIGVAFLSILANYKILTLRDFVAWIGFLIICVVTSIETANPVAVGRIVLGYLSFLCAFIIPLCLVKSVRDVDRLTDVIILSSLVPIIVAPFLLDKDFRIQSSFNHPNIFASYIVVVMATILFKWSSHIFSPSLLRRLVYVGYFAALGALLLYTKTRSAWAGAALLLSIFALFIDRRAILPLLMAAAIALLDPGIRDRLFDTVSETEYIGNGVIMNSYTWRQALWSSAFVWIEERPLLGHGGLGTFFENSLSFFPFAWARVYAHSVYVRLLFETGVIGLILYGAIFLQIFWCLFRLAWVDWRGSIIGAALTLAYLAFCYADNMMGYLASNWYTFFFLGILISIERNLSGRVALPAGVESFARHTPSERSRCAQRFNWSAGRGRRPQSMSPFCRIKPTMRRASRRRNELQLPLTE